MQCPAVGTRSTAYTRTTIGRRDRRPCRARRHGTASPSNCRLQPCPPIHSL